MILSEDTVSAKLQVDILEHASNFNKVKERNTKHS